MSALTDEEVVAAFLKATEGHSGREVEHRVPGVTQSDLSRWSRGDWKRLTAAKRRALLKFLEERAEAGEESSARAAAPSYDGLDLPDISFLKPKARDYYNQTVGSYLTRRWPPDLIQRAANDLVSQIRGASTLRQSGAGDADLTEDQQLIVLEGAAKWVEKEYGPV